MSTSLLFLVIKSRDIERELMSSHLDHLLMIDWENIEGCWLLLFSGVTIHHSFTMITSKKEKLVCSHALPIHERRMTND